LTAAVILFSFCLTFMLCRWWYSAGSFWIPESWGHQFGIWNFVRLRCRPF